MRPNALRKELTARRSRQVRWLGRIASVVFAGLMVWLIASRTTSIDWGKVAGALQEMSRISLMQAAALALLSYLLYGSIDWFARIYTQQVARLRQLAIAIVCYAFNLNLGSLIGSVALRYRLYSRSKVAPPTVAQIIALSLLSNWSGYCLLMGLLFVSRRVQLPDGWGVGMLGLQAAGAALLLALLIYLVLCWRQRGQPLRIRGRQLRLPRLRLGILQIAVSSANWMAIAGVVHVLMPKHVEYGVVLAAFLLSSVAGAMAHVPGGLGVLEAVFLALLGDRVEQHQLLAALLAFRAIYYLIPLALAILLYAWLEYQAPGRATARCAGG